MGTCILICHSCQHPADQLAHRLLQHDLRPRLGRLLVHLQLPALWNRHGVRGEAHPARPIHHRLTRPPLWKTLLQKNQGTQSLN